MDATPEQRHDLLVDLDKEQKAYQAQKKRKIRHIISG
jgi:hypothetical protein